MPEKFFGVDLNKKKFIVVCDDNGNLIAKVEFFSYVSFLVNGNERKIRFKEFYTKFMNDERFIDALEIFAKELVSLAKRNKACIVLEDLGFVNCLTKKKKKIRYCGFVDFLIKYAVKQNVVILFVAPNGTSRICSHCGFKIDRRKFKKNKFRCPECGLVIDKDVNSAINIAKKGKRYFDDKKKIFSSVYFIPF